MILNFHALPNIFCSVFLLSLGWAVYVINRTKTNFTFFLLTLSAAIWQIGTFLALLSNNPEIAFFWTKFSYIGVTLIPVTMFHFIVNQFNIKKFKMPVFWAYIIAIGIFIPLTWFNIFLKGVYRYPWGFWFKAAPLHPVYVFSYSAFFFFNLLLLYWTFRKIIGLEKERIRYLLIALFISYGGAIDYLADYGIRVYPIGYVFVVICLMVIAYAITKYRLMDISVIISRAVAEILTVVYLGTIYLSLVWLYRTYVSVRIDLPFIIWTVLFGIIVGQTFQRIRIFVQTSSDKLFLRGKYDYYKELSEASARVGERLSLASILRILYETFYEVVEISKPRIFLPEYFTDPQKTPERYVVYDKETHLPKSLGEQIDFDDPLVGQLILTRSPILDPHKPERELVVPCLLENRLIAIFVLGRKLSEDPYTDEDIRLLEVLASQAAMALDHTRSYEKIRADLETTEKQLARSERLASLGTLTAGVTHEIRNPLTVIRSETERLANQARDLVYLEQHRGLVLKHVDRIAGIVQRMLGLAKEKPTQKIDIDLNELINATLELFTISRISLKKELQEIPRIKGEPEELHQVFVNLIQNAIEAMPEGGRLTLRTYVENERAVAEVSDTGKGIPEEIREKIFDPFFSTRHEGVGLGLSIAYRIIREHGGDIKIRCEEGKGTTFKILF